MTGRATKPLRHLNQSVSRVTSRLARHRIALGLVVAAVGIFLAYIAWISVNGPPFQHHPDDSPNPALGTERSIPTITSRQCGYITSSES